MYPKGSRNARERASRPRKRRFHGNRYTKRNEENTSESSSSRKLYTACTDDITYSPSHFYRIIEFMTVFGALQDLVVCRQCKGNIVFIESGIRGLGFKLVMKCVCGSREINSGPLINNEFEINRRIIFVMRLLGLSREGINIFCGLMDIGKGISQSTYAGVLKHLYDVVSSVFYNLCKKAVKEEKEENEKNGRLATHFKVSGYGSWKKRGFTSLYGVTTLIGHYTGKIVDLVVKSGYCHACAMWNNKKDTTEYAEWYEQHENECSANHQGSAEKMEVDAVTEMFSVSEEKYGVKYLNYIGDGDSKTFRSIMNINPYGDDFPVVKSECIGQVEKRMGSRLRSVKNNEKLDGKIRLTDGVIRKLTTDYGLAIRRNVDSVTRMKTAIMATLDHYCSDTKNPQHSNCPEGAESWCEWRQAESKGQLADYNHPKRLISPEIEKHLIPIYKDLTRDDLLQRCLGGHTQNSNDTFNSTVWWLTPKHLNSGFKIVNMAALMSAGVFNEGCTTILQIMNRLDINIGQQCREFTDDYNSRRLKRQARLSQSRTKKARTPHRLKNTLENEFYEQEEGLLYGSGIVD